MKSVREFEEIFLHRLPVDGRKGINGLACMAETSMAHSPLQGGLFVFVNKRGDTVKILYWDKTGFALWMKRLEAERFHWPVLDDDDTVVLSSQKLEWLLDGYDISRMKPHSTLQFTALF